ncbi:MAG TPA: biotin/lipoate A/B protein ligase family protein [Gemmataceae bacterium]|nr:biotin/lipoate A/B protein ligase family protein [Gemmataceae bacterium]
MPTCRLLPTAAASGAMNMALDEALLRSAVERKVASLRFYTWSEPTLSLGYFQPHADRLADHLLANVAWVRRPTGGDAILHHHELTYTLAIPAGPPWHTAESWLCRFHHAIAAALRQVGVEAQTVVCGEEQRLGPYLCFQHQTPADLRIAGHKVVGSAQRRPHGATMQHGSILLRRSAFAPALPGIAELSGVQIGEAEPEAQRGRRHPNDPDALALAALRAPATRTLEEAIVTELVKESGWTFEPSDWTAEERQAAAELECDKYGTRAWNEKR